MRGSYVEHRALVPVSSRPADVRVTSASGGAGTLDVRDWSAGAGTPVPPGYMEDFQANYVDPQKAKVRITDLAAEFPSLAQVYNLPFSTAGYQRHAQAIVGTATPYTGARGGLTGLPSQQAVVVTSKAWGQDGGNDVTISLVDPHAASMPLSVTVSGSDVTVHLATDAAGSITSTAVQLASALNASPSASALLTASPSDPRGRPQALAIDHTTTVKWFATDVKGNQSAVASAR